MSETTPDPDALQAARELTVALGEMAGQLRVVNERQDKADKRQERTDKFSKRIQRIVLGLVVSLVLDVTLTAIVTVFAFQANTASAQASATIAELHATQIGACEIGNQTLAKQVVLWEHIFQLSTTTRTTPAERKTDAQLLAFIRQTFHARDCPAIYKLPAR